ncbi:MAG: DUF512 domain-containing protein [Bacillota bacterium]|jgi:putative radical SAM enzyme (TIGR03279 family)
MKAKISSVVPGSIAEDLGLGEGDCLLSINGISPVDLIDYGFSIADEYIELEVEKRNQERIVFEIEKDVDDDLGIVFTKGTFDGIKRCKNKCIFCFVDQMPSKLRDSLYVKDDDYRLSFLYGNFITLTNISEKDLDRIKKLHISPLYISVHTINEAMRCRMLGNPKAGEVLKIIKELADAGIDMHTQIVLCPGINDGKELDKTLFGLAELWPKIKSVAVVPVGITKFQKNKNLRVFRFQEARAIIEDVSQHQAFFQNKIGTNFVYLADEFYLMAGWEIPPYEHYEGFPQIENGVGLTRLLWHNFDYAAKKLPQMIECPCRANLVTGRLAEPVLKPIVERINQIKNMTVNLIPLDNQFFGSTVTVAGLLTGSDIVTGLTRWRQKQTDVRPLVLLPKVMLEFERRVFLDGLTLEDVEKMLGIKIIIVEPTGEGIVKTILQMSCGKRVGV